MEIKLWHIGAGAAALLVFSGSGNAASNAKKYTKIRETGNNAGFSNAEFTERMKKIGWRPGVEWCAFFARFVWLNTLTGSKKKAAEKLLAGSSLTTFANFQKDKSGLFEVGKKPKKGSIVIWRRYKNGSPDGWKGHAGIVSSVGTDSFQTIEGNTNADGSPNGNGVYRKTRKYTWNTETGLRLHGFINVK